MERINECEADLLYRNDIDGPRAAAIRDFTHGNIVDLKRMINWIYETKLGMKAQYKIDRHHWDWRQKIRGLV